MKIILSPQRRDDTLSMVKSGDLLIVNGESFDFSQMGDGDTLPSSAISSQWLVEKVDRIDGQLELTVLFPNPWNYSPEQAFPAALLNVPDGRVAMPKPLPDENGGYPELPPLPSTTTPGIIDWTQLITKAMKDAAAAAARLAAAKLELGARNSHAATQIARIQDRIDTIGFGIDIGEATPEDEAEQAALAAPLKAWKVYKYALGKVTTQPGWFESPAWPVEPPIPEIIASPMRAASETI